MTTEDLQRELRIGNEAAKHALENRKLRAENERLRAALQTIVNMNGDVYTQRQRGSGDDLFSNAVLVASYALALNQQQAPTAKP